MSIMKIIELEPSMKMPKNAKMINLENRLRLFRKGIVRKRQQNPKKIIIIAENKKIIDEAFCVNWLSFKLRVTKKPIKIKMRPKD